MLNQGGGLHSFLRNRKTIFLFVFAVALTVRGITFAYYLDSPLPFYSQIKSLDMMLILTQGCNLASGSDIFTFPRAVVAFSTLFADGGPALVTAVVAVQMVLGSFVSVMLASSALNLTGSRIAALTAGLLGATYTNEIFYELFTLKESTTVFAAALCFWALTNALVKMKRSSSATRNAALLIAGLAAALLPLARFLAVIWALCSVVLIILRILFLKRNARFKIISASILIAGLAVLWIPASAWNTYRSGVPAIFDVNVAYNLKAGTHRNLTSYNVDVSDQSQSGKVELFEKAFAHVPYKLSILMSSYQPTDNVNYYFIKGLFPIFDFLPGKMILIPLGLCGFIVILAGIPFSRKLSGLIPLALFICTVFPIAMFVPSDRYALALFPAYALGGAFFIKWISTGVRSLNSGKRLAVPVAGLLMLSAVTMWTLPGNIPLRSSDYTSYAMALHSKYGPVKAVGDAYYDAWKIDPSVSSTVNFGKFFIDSGNSDAALSIMAPYIESGNISPNLLVNFSVALMIKGDFVKAESILESGLILYQGDEGDKLRRALLAVRVQKDAASPPPTVKQPNIKEH